MDEGELLGADVTGSVASVVNSMRLLYHGTTAETRRGSCAMAGFQLGREFLCTARAVRERSR